MEVLKKENIEQHLRTRGPVLKVYDCVASTNQLAKEYGENGAEEGLVVLADSQTAGRGRLGRSFCSPAGTGLYMSLLLRPSLSAEKALSITTAAAVAVCRAIERVSPRKAQIKWVNDIYCDGKKVCGILTEAAFEHSGMRYAVLGIGINVTDPKDGFPRDIADIAASVFGKQDGDRHLLAAAVLDAFFEEYEHLNEERFVREYRERSCLIGKAVTVKAAAGDRDATVLDVDEACRLLVRYEDGREEALSSGDVSIRLR